MGTRNSSCRGAKTKEKSVVCRRVRRPQDVECEARAEGIGISVVNVVISKNHTVLVLLLLLGRGGLECGHDCLGETG